MSTVRKHDVHNNFLSSTPKPVSNNSAKIIAEFGKMIAFVNKYTTYTKTVSRILVLLTHIVKM